MYINFRKNSLRLKDFNYKTPGYYFITIDTYDKKPLFINNQICLIIKKIIVQLKIRFKFKITAGCIMPNHLHVIIMLSHNNKINLSQIIQAYKSLTTREINLHSKTYQKIWQRGYYDHIIRNEKDLEEKYYYILNNPLKANPVKKPEDYKYYIFDN